MISAASIGIVSKTHANQPSNVDHLRWVRRKIISLGSGWSGLLGTRNCLVDVNPTDILEHIHAAGHDLVGLNNFFITSTLGEWISREVPSTAAAEGVAMGGSAAVGLVLGHKLDLWIIKQWFLQIDLALWIADDFAGGMGHPEDRLGHGVRENIGKLFVNLRFKAEKRRVCEMFCNSFLEVGFVCSSSRSGER